MKKVYILFVTVLIVMLTGCLTYENKYDGQYKELHTTEIHSIPDAVVLLVHGEGVYDSDIYVWEQQLEPSME